MSGSVESDRPSDPVELDRSIDRLRDKAPAFARLPISQKVRLLREVARGVVEEAGAWVRSGHRAKSLPEGSGEEWIVGPLPTLRNIRLLASTLTRMDQGGPAIPPARVTTATDGQVEVAVHPTDPRDAALFWGVSVRQRMLPGESEKTVIEMAGRAYHEPGDGAVSLVLGAGNVSSIPAMDVLARSFGEGSVCLLKMNPVNEWVGPHLERAFAPLIQEGFLDICYGGAEVGRYLVEHPVVSDVHITGSAETHDLIVWGPPGPERERRKSVGDPLFKKRMTSELGNISPVIIVPAEYSDRELSVVALNVASMVTNNASFNCNASKMLILATRWGQRNAFLRTLSATLSSVPTRLAYYPGAFDRFRLLTEGRERVERIGSATPTKLPWTLLYDLDPRRRDDPAFSIEPFCPILSIVGLDAGEPGELLEAAVPFANDVLWGTLNAMIVLPGRLERSREVGLALQRAIRDLRYGTVAVNQWPALVYGLAAPAWGGHPSSTLEDIQSGMGFVHNTYLLEGVEKSVLHAPLDLMPKPVWYPNHRTARELGRKLLELEAAPSWWRMPGLALTALRG